MSARHATTRLVALNPDTEDWATALADCRIALSLASGVAIDDIDPSLGFNISDAAYRTVRAQWAEIADRASYYDRGKYERTAALWRRYRPDLAADWPAWGGEGS